jgi:hypothetical protein
MLQWDYKTNKAKLENESASKIQTNLNFRIVQFAKKKKKKKTRLHKDPKERRFDETESRRKWQDILYYSIMTQRSAFDCSAAGRRAMQALRSTILWAHR